MSPEHESGEASWDEVPGFTEIQDAEVLSAWTANIEDEVQTFARATLGITTEDIWDSEAVQIAERYLLQHKEEAADASDAQRQANVKYFGGGIRRIVEGTWVCLPAIADAPDKFGVRPRLSWLWQYLIAIAPNIDLALNEEGGEIWKGEFETIRENGRSDPTPS